MVPAPMLKHWELLYDLDKSVRAKEDVFAMIRAKMAPDGAIVIDAIDRDPFFRRVAARWGGRALVFCNVGVVGLAERLGSGMNA